MLQDHKVGEDVIADYLLYYLNKYNHNRYGSLETRPNHVFMIGDYLSFISTQ